MEINIIVDKRQSTKGKRGLMKIVYYVILEVQRLIVFFFVLHMNCSVWQRAFKRATCYLLNC